MFGVGWQLGSLESDGEWGLSSRMVVRVFGVE